MIIRSVTALILLAFDAQSYVTELEQQQAARRSDDVVRSEEFVAAVNQSVAVQGGLFARADQGKALCHNFTGLDGTTLGKRASAFKVIKKPPDGNCLFHALAHGFGNTETAAGLRREIAIFIMKNPTLAIQGTTIQDWVKWETDSTVDAYARRIASGAWGGQVEIAVCSYLKKVTINVYEGRNRNYSQAMSFPNNDTTKIMYLLYRGRAPGGAHYDALEPNVPGPPELPPMQFWFNAFLAVYYGPKIYRYCTTAPEFRMLLGDLLPWFSGYFHGHGEKRPDQWNTYDPESDHRARQGNQYQDDGYAQEDDEYYDDEGEGEEDMLALNSEGNTADARLAGSALGIFLVAGGGAIAVIRFRRRGVLAKSQVPLLAA